MLTSLSVDEILLPRYGNLSTNYFRSAIVERALSHLKRKDSVLFAFTWRPPAACSGLCGRDSAWVYNYQPLRIGKIWHKGNFKWCLTGFSSVFFLLDWLPNLCKRCQATLLFTHSWKENNWIPIFPKGIPTMRNTISLTQNLNQSHSVHFLRRSPLHHGLFILSERSDFHRVDILSIAVHTFRMCMVTSLSVDEVLLPSYVNWFTYFKKTCHLKRKWFFLV